MQRTDKNSLHRACPRREVPPFPRSRTRSTCLIRTPYCPHSLPLCRVASETKARLKNCTGLLSSGIPLHRLTASGMPLWLLSVPRPSPPPLSLSKETYPQTSSRNYRHPTESSQQGRTLAYMSASPLLKNFRSPDSTFHSDVVCRIQSEHNVYAEFSAAGRTASHFTGPSVEERALISLLRCLPVL